MLGFRPIAALAVSAVPSFVTALPVIPSGGGIIDDVPWQRERRRKRIKKDDDAIMAVIMEFLERVS